MSTIIENERDQLFDGLLDLMDEQEQRQRNFIYDNGQYLPAIMRIPLMQSSSLSVTCLILPNTDVSLI